MAGRAEPHAKKGLETLVPTSHPNASDTKERDLVFEHAAKLYGQGYARSRVARIMLDHLVPHGKERPKEQRLSQARSKLRRWENMPKFRDLIYHKAVVDLDLDTPAILKGVASKAKRGRVDAARLALELTGRHTPKGDPQPTQVVVAINGIPRPQTQVEAGVIELEGEAIEVEDDV